MCNLSLDEANNNLFDYIIDIVLFDLRSLLFFYMFDNMVSIHMMAKEKM